VEVKALVQLFWVVGMVCQAALAVVLLLRKSWKAFPVFTLYSIFNLFAALFVYMAQHDPRLYFYSYWLAEAVGILLGFGVLYEVFRHLFLGHAALRKVASFAFNCGLIIVIAIAVIVLLKHSAAGFSAISSAVLILEESARIIEVGALVSLFVLSSAFGLHWRQQVFGIALGLGMFTAVELITVTMRTQSGQATYYLLGAVRILAFNASLLVWLGYFMAREKTTIVVDLPQRSQLEQWNQAVMELIRQ
jgi:hypothetical protein